MEKASNKSTKPKETIHKFYFQAWWVCAYNASVQVAEVRILLQFLGQYELHSEFHMRADYRIRC